MIAGLKPGVTKSYRCFSAEAGLLKVRMASVLKLSRKYLSLEEFLNE